MTGGLRHVILDRDGVLNIEDPSRRYVTDWTQWRWVPGALDGLRLLTSANIEVSIATNQSCIGLGAALRSEVDGIHARMEREAERNGAVIGRVLVCPHAPREGCNCRKPAPGLLESAISAVRIPLRETVLVGDDLRDVEAADNAGVQAIVVRSGKGRETERILCGRRLAVFDDLLQFAEFAVAGPIFPASPGSS